MEELENLGEPTLDLIDFSFEWSLHYYFGFKIDPVNGNIDLQNSEDRAKQLILDMDQDWTLPYKVSQKIFEDESWKRSVRYNL